MAEKDCRIADFILNAYAPILSIGPDKITEIGVTIPIPTFNENTLTSIVTIARDIFMMQETLIDVPLPVYVVGDLHGNIFDLIRILIMTGPPPKNRFLFLGDYVDRGQYSIEIVTLLFALLAKYPEHIFLIRGNHEFSRVNEVYGFKNEVISLYKSQLLFDNFNKCFNYMPLVALISKSIFCVHGGISQQIASLKQLKKIKRPIPDYVNNITSELTWNDPSPDVEDYSTNVRGNCVVFGAQAVQNFLTSFKLKHIFRAHQVVDLGIEKFAGDGLYTIFSCSNYQEGLKNRCGILLVHENEEIQTFSLPEIVQIPREKCLTSGETIPGRYVPFKRRSSFALNQYSDDESNMSQSTDGNKIPQFNSQKISSIKCLKTPMVNTPLSKASLVKKRTMISVVGLNKNCRILSSQQTNSNFLQQKSQPESVLPSLKE